MSILKGHATQGKYKHYKFIKIFVLLIYSFVLITSYFLAERSLAYRKTEILNSYYNLILNHSAKKLEYILDKLSTNANEGNISVNVEKSNIQVCSSTKCIRDNIFEFSSMVDRYLPHFINYKIQINNQLLHFNNKLNAYDLEKTHHISSYNRLSIGVSMTPNYWNNLKFEILKPFFFIVIIFTFLLILFLFSIKFLINHFKNLYCSYFKDAYEKELTEAENHYKNELAVKENILIKKVWDLEYVREKDIELNYLFAQEANALAFTMEALDRITTLDKSGHNFFNYKYCKGFPCSIVLYYETRTLEKISVTSLMEAFSNRFVRPEDNVAVSIASTAENVYFASKGSLYQIIYSIMSYIIFILKEQSNFDKFNLGFNIVNKKGDKESLCLLFKYDGAPLYSEEEVFRFSDKFFRKHANPFLLAPSQVFDLLKANNFRCKLGYKNLNFIKITQEALLEGIGELGASNVIKLPKK